MIDIADGPWPMVGLGRVFGCPCALFASRPEAETWLRDGMSSGPVEAETASSAAP